MRIRRKPPTNYYHPESPVGDYYGDHRFRVQDSRIRFVSYDDWRLIQKHKLTPEQYEEWLEGFIQSGP